MSRFLHSLTPVYKEDEADIRVAELSGNPYHAELEQRRYRLDLSLVILYTETKINDMDNTAIPCVSCMLSNGLQVTLMETYEDFTVEFDKYHGSLSAYVVDLTAVK